MDDKKAKKFFDSNQELPLYIDSSKLEKTSLADLSHKILEIHLSIERVNNKLLSDYFIGINQNSDLDEYEFDIVLRSLGFSRRLHILKSLIANHEDWLKVLDDNASNADLVQHHVSVIKKIGKWRASYVSYCTYLNEARNHIAHGDKQYVNSGQSISNNSGKEITEKRFHNGGGRGLTTVFFHEMYKVQISDVNQAWLFPKNPEVIYMDLVVRYWKEFRQHQLSSN